MIPSRPAEDPALSSPRARRREDVRARILAEARRIVLAEGFDALTMRRIAKAAGYSPAALYLHFASRDAIARELGGAGMRSLHAALAAAATEADPLARLHALAKAYAGFAAAEPDTYRLIFMEPGFAAAALGGEDEAGTAAFALLVEAFAALGAAGRLRPGADGATLATTLWTLLHGIASLKMTCGAFLVRPTEELLAQALEHLFHGLLRPEGES